MLNTTLTWWTVCIILVIFAAILLLNLSAANKDNRLSFKQFGVLCASGAISACVQGVILSQLEFLSMLHFASTLTITILGALAGILVFDQLRNDKIDGQTASALLLVGQVVYPAFLAVHLFWSWDV